MPNQQITLDKNTLYKQRDKLKAVNHQLTEENKKLWQENFDLKKQIEGLKLWHDSHMEGKI